MQRAFTGKRVLIIGLQPDAGHLTPICQIAARLRDEGAEVLAILPEEARALVASFRLTSQLLGPVESAEGTLALDNLARASRFSAALYAERIYNRDYVLAKKARGFEQLAELTARARAFHPDVILADEHRFAAQYRQVARVTNAPLVLFESYGTHYLAQPERPWWAPRSPMEKQLLASVSALGRWLQRPYDRLFSREDLIRFRHNRQSLRCLQSKFANADAPAPAELRVTMGIAPLEERYLAGEINLLQDVLFFGPAPPSACWNGSEHIREWLQDEDSRPVVYIAFGTMVVPPRAVLRKLVTAAVERGARVLVATRQDPRSRNNRARKQDVLWTSWAPQSAILAEDCIKAFVTHAGRMSIQEGLWYGKPMLCIPRLWDQFYNSWVAERLGYGIGVGPDAPAQAVSAAIERLLTEPDLGARAQALSTELKALDGVSTLMTRIAETVFTPETMAPSLQR